MKADLRPVGAADRPLVLPVERIAKDTSRRERRRCVGDHVRSVQDGPRQAQTVYRMVYSTLLVAGARSHRCLEAAGVGTAPGINRRTMMWMDTSAFWK